MGVQKRLSQFGIAKQASKGAAEAEPTYLVGLTGGAAYTTDVNEGDLDTTWDNRLLQGHDRESVVPGSSAECVALPQSIGLLLSLALGSVSTTGAGPYVHTIKPSNSLPWATLFGSYGAEKVEIADAKIDSLELSWSKSGAVKVKTKWMGITVTFDSAWVIGAGTPEQVGGGVVRAGGGTFLVNGAAAKVTAGTITLSNNLEALVSTAVTPDDIFEAEVGCTVSLTVRPDDLTLWRYAVTGATNGTTVSSAPVYGTLDLTFSGPSSETLQFVGNHVRAMVNVPDSDPSGGAAEITLEGVCADPGDNGVTDSFKFVLTNSVATY